MANPQAVSEAKEEIMKAVNEHCENLEKDEYVQVLEEVIGDLKTNLDAAEIELQEEEDGEADEE